jgi:hypothetical protein
MRADECYTDQQQQNTGQFSILAVSTTTALSFLLHQSQREIPPLFSKDLIGTD